VTCFMVESAVSPVRVTSLLRRQHLCCPPELQGATYEKARVESRYFESQMTRKVVGSRKYLTVKCRARTLIFCTRPAVPNGQERQGRQNFLALVQGIKEHVLGFTCASSRYCWKEKTCKYKWYHKSQSFTAATWVLLLLVVS
jgi:hypothetical protein